MGPTIPQLLMFLLGAILPIIMTIFIPQKNSRTGGCVMVFVGLGFISQMAKNPSAFAIGMCVGIFLASIKLIINLRWL